MEANDSVLHGTMWRVKTKKAAAALWATPRAGAAGATDWHVPLLVWRSDYAAEHGSPPTFALPQIHTQWAVVEPAPISYTTARRYLVAIAEAAEIQGASALTLQSPRTFTPTASSQLG